jgi:hypothetical protein
MIKLTIYINNLTQDDELIKRKILTICTSLLLLRARIDHVDVDKASRRRLENVFHSITQESAKS